MYVNLPWRRILCLICCLPQLLFAQGLEPGLADSSFSALSQMWETYSLNGEDDKALFVAKLARSKAEATFSIESKEFGDSYDFLGYSQHHTGQLLGAEKSFQMAVQLAQHYFGVEHEDYITLLCNLAMLHMDMGELAKAVS